MPLKMRPFFPAHLPIAALGRTKFTGHGKLTAGQHPLQITPLMSIDSPLLLFDSPRSGRIHTDLHRQLDG